MGIETTVGETGNQKALKDSPSGEMQVTPFFSILFICEEGETERTSYGH